MLDSFYGNCQAISMLKAEIEGSLKRGTPFGKTLVSGHPGMGKSFLASEMAKSLGLEFVNLSCESMEAIGGLNMLADIADGYYGSSILLCVDRIDRLSLGLQTKLAVALQDGIIAFRSREVSITKLDLVLTCNSRHNVLPSILDAIHRDVHLERYSCNELADVISCFTVKDKAMVAINVWKEQWYRVEFSTDICIKIGERSRGCPRTAMDIVKRYYNYLRKDTTTAVDAVIASCDDALDSFFLANAILPLGYTRLDQRYMELLLLAGKPLGLGSIATNLGISPEHLELEVEPFLRQGRMIFLDDDKRELTVPGRAVAVNFC
jgi:Holliday junction resolvasome RuvABC ATP-dependent DNA helicase subunit